MHRAAACNASGHEDQRDPTRAGGLADTRITGRQPESFPPHIDTIGRLLTCRRDLGLAQRDGAYIPAALGGAVPRLVPALLSACRP
jgi:hypothetical protein